MHTSQFLADFHLIRNDVCQDQRYSTKYSNLVSLQACKSACTGNLKYWLKIKTFLTVNEILIVQLMQRAINKILL